MPLGERFSAGKGCIKSGDARQPSLRFDWLFGVTRVGEQGEKLVFAPEAGMKSVNANWIGDIASALIRETIWFDQKRRGCINTGDDGANWLGWGALIWETLCINTGDEVD